MRLSSLLPIATFVGLAAVFSSYLYQIGAGEKNISDVPSALIDKPVPEFKLPPIVGRNDGFATSDLADKISLVYVFASLCGPCRIEHPILMRLAREGVPIYAINYKDKPKDALRFLADLGNPYRRIGTDAVQRAA